MRIAPLLTSPPAPSPHLTRRQFVTAGTAIVAGVAVGAHTANALTVRIPGTPAARRARLDAWLPESPSADQLRTLALAAIDAARAAGADFADVRIGAQRYIHAYGYPNGPLLGLSISYGVRAWIGDTWSFQYGNVLTPDAMAATARSAVEGARRYAAIEAQLSMRRHNTSSTAYMAANRAWAPVPVATGEWRVPVEIDPFTVPLDDYQRVIGALGHITVPEALRRAMQASAFGYALGWQTETRVFASTAGSLVTQETIVGGLGIQSTAASHPLERSYVFLHQPRLSRVAAGFETALRLDIPEHIQQLYDEVTRWIRLPRRTFDDVGRVPVVLDGTSMAGVFGSTVDMALDGDRVSGLEADASGGSFLSPALDVLEAPAPSFSPLLTAQVHRALPSPTAVQWDDDGVAPETYTVLDRGRVVDFHTTRETAPMLSEWYARHGLLLRSHGTAVAPTADSVPRGTGGHLTVAPATTRTQVDDLIRGMSHGFLVINGAVHASPGLTTGIITPRQDGLILEIQRGVPVARTGLRLQFTTQSLLRGNLIALGDETTAQTSEIQASKGIPWQSVAQLVTAPAALCKDVDVIRWG